LKKQKIVSVLIATLLSSAHSRNSSREKHENKATSAMFTPTFSDEFQRISELYREKRHNWSDSGGGKGVCTSGIASVI
jgi:hypothetical protein